MFTRCDFHWNPSRAVGIGGLSEKKAESRIDNAIKILNDLTPKQQEAVRLYSTSRYEEGIDNGGELYYRDED